MTAVQGDRARKVIAIVIAAGGLGGYVLVAKSVGTLREQWPKAIAFGERWVVLANGAILVAFAVIASAAVIGGILLWRRTRVGDLVCRVVLGVQLLFVAVPGFQYRVALFGLLGFGLTGSRIGVFFETGPQMFFAFDPDDLRAFVVNIPALVMLLVLIKTAPPVRDSHVQNPPDEGPPAPPDTSPPAQA